MVDEVQRERRERERESVKRMNLNRLSADVSAMQVMEWQ